MVSKNGMANNRSSEPNHVSSEKKCGLFCLSVTDGYKWDDGPSSSNEVWKPLSGKFLSLPKNHPVFSRIDWSWTLLLSLCPSFSLFSSLAPTILIPLSSSHSPSRTWVYLALNRFSLLLILWSLTSRKKRQVNWEANLELVVFRIVQARWSTFKALSNCWLGRSLTVLCLGCQDR